MNDLGQMSGSPKGEQKESGLSEYPNIKTEGWTLVSRAK